MSVQARSTTAALTGVALAAFAGNSLLCRLALRDAAIDPVSFTAIRIASGALVLLPVALRGGAWSVRGSLALFVYALGFSLAYVTLDAGTGALLLFGLVQLTMMGAGLRRGERRTPLQTVGVLAAAAGVVYLVSPGLASPDPTGAVLMGAAGVAWGLYSLFGRGVRDPAAATARNFALAVPPALIALLVARERIAIEPRGALLAALSGAVTSGLGYAVWYRALRGHSATSAAIVQLSVPVLAAFGGVALLAETLTPRLLAASAATLGGVGLALWRPRAES